MKASANKGKYDKKVVRKETRAYEEKLQLELNMEMTKAIENELLDGFCLQSESAKQCRTLFLENRRKSFFYNIIAMYPAGFAVIDNLIPGTIFFELAFIIYCTNNKAVWFNCT